MKSSKEDLKRRGFFNIEDVNEYQHFTNEELINLINSSKATERSIAINILSNRDCIKDMELVKILLKRLCIEKSLYTKIEICNTLEKGDIETAKEMIQYLGAIGKNQYRCLPDRVSKKNSYPLPRDIIARTLGKMESTILPVLFDVLESDEEDKISEVIDAIGFMLFYNQENDHNNFLKDIKNIMIKHSNSDIIVWKCVLCLSSFWTQDSIDFLNKVLNSNRNEIIKCEANRSLKIINSKLKSDKIIKNQKMKINMSSGDRLN